MTADQPLEPSQPGETSPYPDDREVNRRSERRLLGKEFLAIAIVIVIAVVRQLWLD